ncbi:hypothetical protein BCR36DRAFT_250486, partial [Piromyces finnis]
IVCPVEIKGYKCCNDPNLQSMFEDVDGQWYYENDEWCLIVSSPIISTTTTTTTVPGPTETPFVCPVESKGYKCCNDPNLQSIFEDEDGQWYYENDEWC